MKKMIAENRVGMLVRTSGLLLAAATSASLTACSSAPASPSTTTTAPSSNPRADDFATTPSSSEAKRELPLQTETPPVAAAATEQEQQPPVPSPPPPTPKRQQALDPVFGCSRAAVIVVLDRSGSMTGRPLEMAAEGTQRVAGAMTANDCFGMLVFDSEVTRMVPIAKMTDQHREATTAALKRVTAGGGTDIQPALTLALQDIRAVTSTKKKLVIFVTDGQSPNNGLPDLAKTMGNENIFLTTIALGSGADKDLLRELASSANGRFHSVMNIEQLPRVFEKEAQIITTGAKK
jgi:Mg-chelatase subunit ChlD